MNGLPKIKLPEKRPSIKTNIGSLAKEMMNLRNTLGEQDKEENEMEGHESPYNMEGTESEEVVMEHGNLPLKRGRQESPLESASRETMRERKRTKEEEITDEIEKQREEAARQQMQEREMQVPKPQREWMEATGARPKTQPLVKEKQQQMQTGSGDTGAKKIILKIRRTKTTEGFERVRNWNDEKEIEKLRKYSEKNNIIMETNNMLYFNEEVIRILGDRTCWRHIHIQLRTDVQFKTEYANVMRRREDLEQIRRRREDLEQIRKSLPA